MAWNQIAFSIESIVGSGWTEQLPNGSLIGMGSQLLRGEADVMISVNEFRPYRAEQLALGIVIHRTRLYYFLNGQPVICNFRIYGKDDMHRVHAYFKRSTTVLENLYFMPFQSSLWIVAAIFFGLLTTVYATSAAVLRKVLQLNAQDGKLSGDWDFTWIFSIICQKGKGQQPERHMEKAMDEF